METNRNAVELPNSISPKFQDIMKREGATWRRIASPVDRDPSVMIEFPGDLDLTKYALELGDFPEDINVAGNLTIDARHYFMIDDDYNIGGDVIVTGRWSHATPADAAGDLGGYLTDRILSGKTRGSIGGRVRMVLDKK